MIRDMMQAANNPDAPLAEKLALFGASAIMTDADRELSEQMIGVLSRTGTPTALPAPDDIVESTIKPAQSQQVNLRNHSRRV
jgi:hypothetical protein